MKLTNMKILAPVIFAVSIFLLSHLVEKKFNSISLENPTGEKKDTIYLDSTKCHYKVVTTYDSSISESYFINKTEYKFVNYNIYGQKTQEAFLNERLLVKDLYTTYYPDGKIQNQLFLFNVEGNDSVHMPNPWNNNKDTAMVIFCQDGHSIEYYQNGNIKEEHTTINCKKTGAFTKYFENGVIQERGYFYMGKPIGIYYYYNEKGIIIKSDTLFKTVPDCDVKKQK